MALVTRHRSRVTHTTSTQGIVPGRLHTWPSSLGIVPGRLHTWPSSQGIVLGCHVCFVTGHPALSQGIMPGRLHTWPSSQASCPATPHMAFVTGYRARTTPHMAFFIRHRARTTWEVGNRVACLLGRHHGRMEHVSLLLYLNNLWRHVLSPPL
jgi:hypothetical protein